MPPNRLNPCRESVSASSSAIRPAWLASLDIGYVCPPAGRFRSWGELLNAIRAAASLYGADAVYVDQQKEMEGWGFSINQWGGGGGKWRTVQVRATTVVWEE